MGVSVIWMWNQVTLQTHRPPVDEFILSLITKSTSHTVFEFTSFMILFQI